MKQYQFHSGERGSAILLVLGILTIVMTLAIVFAMTSRNRAAIAKASAETGRLDLLAESTTARVTSLLYYMGRNGADPKSSFTHLQKAPADRVAGMVKISRLTALNDGDHARYYRADGTSGGTTSVTRYPTPDYQEVMYSTSAGASGLDGDVTAAINSTPYGKFLTENTDLLSDNADAGVKQLDGLSLVSEERNRKTHGNDSTGSLIADDIYRWAFLAVNDTSKFNINDLMNYKDANGVVPAITNQGEYRSLAGIVIESPTASDPGIKPFDASPTTKDMITNWMDPGSEVSSESDGSGTTYKFVGNIANIFPILGYVDPAHPAVGDRLIAKADEANTLRYGIHPQELVVPNAYRDLIGEPPAKAPLVPSMDLLVSDPSLKDVDTKMESPKRYFMLYSVASGKEDTETYKTDAGTAEQPKINIQYPGYDYVDSDNSANVDKDNGNVFSSQANLDKTRWEKISASARVAGNFDTAMADLNARLGGGANKFCYEDGADATSAVYANLIDFSDSDELVTHNFEFGGERVKISTDFTDNAKSFKKNQDIVCGNERVPAITSVAIKANVKDGGKVTNKMKPLTRMAPGGVEEVIEVKAWDSSTLPTLSLSVSATLDNCFQEAASGVQPKVRFVVKGRYCIYYISEYEGLPSGVEIFDILPSGDYIFSQKHKGLEVIDNTRYRDWCGKALEAAASDSMAERSAGNLEDLVVGNTVDFVWVSDDAHAVVTPAKDLAALSRYQMAFPESKVVSPYGTAAGERSGSVADGVGHIKGMGLFMAIDEVVAVMANDDRATDQDELIDIVHYHDDTQDAKNIHGEHNLRSIYENESIGDDLGKLLAGDSNSLIGWMTTLDPRSNHRNSAWVWHNASARNDGNTNTFDSGASLELTNDSNVAAVMQDIKDDVTGTLKNTGLANVDTETTLNLDGSGVASAVTYSTAFIPNHPVTNFWQLGAVHRGEPCRTINLNRYGIAGGGKYDAGDGWILDRLKLSGISKDTPVMGKFNPNCMNENSFRYLIEGLPSDNGAYSYEQYRDDATAAHYTAPEAAFPGWLNNGSPGSAFNQPSPTTGNESWLPVQAMYNYLQGTANVAQSAPNDREAEKIFACIAGLLSTRYETFTVFTVSQSLKYIATDSHVRTIDDQDKGGTDPLEPDTNLFLKQFANPMLLTVKKQNPDGTEADANVWYEKRGTQVRILTIVRDCWKNELEVIRSQKYE